MQQGVNEAVISVMPSNSQTPTTPTPLNDQNYIDFYDKRFEKSREHLVFMEETKVYQKLLNVCTQKAGPDAPVQCAELFETLRERLEYYNSKFRSEKRPTRSPALNPEHEKRQ